MKNIVKEFSAFNYIFLLNNSHQDYILDKGVQVALRSNHYY